MRTAFELFSQRGFSGTTTKDIARSSGVSEAMVFKHFASKDELYNAILEAKKGGQKFPWEGKDLRTAMEENDDFGVFYNLALHMFKKHRNDTTFMRMILYSALEGHDLADRFFAEFVSKFYEFMGGYIKKRQAVGAFRNLEPKMIVRSFLGMVIHHSLNNTLWDKKRRLVNVKDEDAARTFTDILLCGIREQGVSS